jgi:spore coat protein U-like protein
MKTFIKTVTFLSAVATINANATIQLSHTNQTSFQIGGRIAAECKINSTTAIDSSTLNLASSAAQEIADVEIWCNTGQATASTTYESLNNGVLDNENHAGQDIAYLIDISDTESNLSLTTPQTVNQAAGSGVSGTSQSRVVSIKPQITGFEYEGVYSDTILVTVTLN